MASVEQGLSALISGDLLPDNIDELVQKTFNPEDSEPTPAYVREWFCVWFAKYHLASKSEMCKEIIKHAIAVGNGAVCKDHQESSDLPMQEFEPSHVETVLQSIKSNKKMQMLIALILPNNPSLRGNILRFYTTEDQQTITEALIAKYEQNLDRSDKATMPPEVRVPRGAPAAAGGAGGKATAAKPLPAPQPVPMATPAEAPAAGDNADKTASLSTKGKERPAEPAKQALDPVLPLIAGFMNQPEPALKEMLCAIMKSVVDGGLKIDDAQMTKVFTAYMNARQAACLKGKSVPSMRRDAMLLIYEKIDKIQAEDFGDFHDALTEILFGENPLSFGDAGQFPLARNRARKVLDAIIVKQATLKNPAQSDGVGAAGTPVRDQTGGKLNKNMKERNDAVSQLYEKFKQVQNLDPKDHEGTIHAFLFDEMRNAGSCREVQNLWVMFVMVLKRFENAVKILNVERFLGEVIETFSGLRCHEAKTSYLKGKTDVGVKKMVKLWEEVDISEVLDKAELLPKLFQKVDVNSGKVCFADSAPLRRFLSDRLKVYLMTFWANAHKNAQKARAAGGSKDQVTNQPRVPAAEKQSLKRKEGPPSEEEADVAPPKKTKDPTLADPDIMDPPRLPVKPAPTLGDKRKASSGEGGEGGANDADEVAAPTPKITKAGDNIAAPTLEHAKRAVSQIMEQTLKAPPAANVPAPAPRVGKVAASAPPAANVPAPAPRVGKVAASAPPAGKAAAPAPPAGKAAAPAPPASPAAPAPPAPALAKPDFRTSFAEAQQLVREFCKQKEPEPIPEVERD